jgi:hypothetical protein
MLPSVPELAQAGFLHGVSEIRLIRGLGLAPEVEMILASRKRLWAIDKFDPDVPERLVTDVLPSLSRADGALLLVAEQILHLDADSIMSLHTRAFNREPVPLTGIIRSIDVGSTDRPRQLDFFQSVVIPTAKFFGLWLYRNTAENLVLYYSDRARFDSLLQFAINQTAKGEPGIREHRIREILGRRDDIDILWEWHHLRSLDQTLSGPPDNWTSRLSLCGMVTVACDQPEQCYEILGHLHLAEGYEHQPALQDFVAMPRSSGYQAIHTILSPSGKDFTGNHSTRVRIITRPAQEERLVDINERRLSSMQRQIEARRTRGLRVFANDGQAVLLPAGSVVLNFAYEIHNDFVALARSAAVNKESLDLLHPLREGDVINLIVGDVPQPLPPGWETRVPSGTAAKIRRKFNAVYRPHLIAAGRRWLRQLLADRGAKEALSALSVDDSALDSHVADAIAAYPADAQHPTTTPDFLRDLGILIARRTSADQIPELDSLIGGAVDRIAAVIRNARAVPIEDFILPSHNPSAFDRLVICPTCRPTPGKEVVGLLARRRLVVHQANRKCGIGGHPIIWRRRFSRGQYFVVEMNNRQGIAVEILSLVKDRMIDLQDHVGTSLGPGWAVLRFHVHSLSSDAVAGLLRAISSIPGVLRVLGPESPVVQSLEGPLPSRERRLISGRSSPYVCGPVIMDDRFFYGRGNELAELRKWFDLTRLGGAERGSNIFVSGPLKTGKTSLVERFLREVRRAEYECIVVKTVALLQDPKDPQRNPESWGPVSTSLRSDLMATMPPDLKEKVSVGYQSEIPLEDLLISIRSIADMPVVLVVDEAVSMFSASAGTPEQAQLQRFMSTLAQTAGMLAIWIGPDAPVADLPPALSEALRTAHEIRVAPFREGEVLDLLRAKNMEDMGTKIHAEEKLGVELWRFTGGNPYWCNIVAEAMFDKAKTVADGALNYGRGELNRARPVLVGHQRAFSDRIAEIDHPRLGGIVGFILRLLSRQDAEGKQLTVADVCHAAIQRGFDTNDDELLTILRRLVARGSVRRKAVKGRIYWGIDCPALRGHVLNEIPVR